MVKKIKSLLLTLTTLSFVAVPALAAAPAYAQVTQDQINGNVCSGTNFDLRDGGNISDCGDTTQANFNTLLAKIINIFSAIVGVIAVIMIIVGGLRYITSGGDTSHVSTAKTTIIYALVGLVIVALAQLIVHFVLNQSTGLLGG